MDDLARLDKDALVARVRAAERDEVRRADKFLRMERVASKDNLRRAEKAEAERDALAAVVEQVREYAEASIDAKYGTLSAAMMLQLANTAPSAALDHVKAEAAVQALREAADGFRYCEDYGYRATRVNASEDYLNARADRIEKGESNE